MRKSSAMELNENNKIIWLFDGKAYTGYVYGEQRGLVDENCSNLKPKSPYAEIKIREENILKKNAKKIKFISFRFGTISGISKGMRFHTAINKFSFYAALGQPLPIWKSMMNKPRPYLSLKDAFNVIKFTIETAEVRGYIEEGSHLKTL